MRTTGTILVQGKIGRTGKIVVPGVSSREALKNFLTSIESSYMAGKGVSASYSETETLSATIDAGNSDRRAVITYMDNTLTQKKRISIPGWGTGAGRSEETPDGERVPLVACQSVAEALETATGHSMTGLSGYIIQTR